MNFDNLVNKAKKYFPDLSIKYKDQSFLMKVLGMILFFNKSFMTNMASTIGKSIYFPSEKYIEENQRSSKVVLLHELVHMHDAEKMGGLLFNFLYMLPFTLIPFGLILSAICPFALLFCLACLLPIPAYFRMKFERRAYMVSMYASYVLRAKENGATDFNSMATIYLPYFKTSKYYFMWTFKSLDKEFLLAAENIRNGKHPYEDSKLFAMIDNILQS